MTVLCGCESLQKSFFDPSEVGRWEMEAKEPLMVRILTQLQPGTDDPDPEYSTAGDVRAEDLVLSQDEYVIHKGDLITVTVEDLQGQGAQSVMTRTVNERGQIRLQLLDEPLQALGLTEGELEQVAKQAYIDANQLPDPQVSVIVNEAQGRTYTVSGAVGAPSRYLIYRPDLRLMEALVQARGVQIGVETIYVIRQPLPQRPTAGGEPAEDPLVPRPRATAPATSAAQDTEGAERFGTLEGQAVPVRPTAAGQPSATAEGFQFNPPQEPSDQRVLRIPYERLAQGEQKYNVVIRPNDMIVAPIPQTGVYYMGGHIARIGAYSITPDNQVTLTRAVVAAGMLDEVGIPWRTEVIRRVGPDQQIWVSVNLDRVFAGKDADIMLRPDDVVMVGTTWYASFLAAARNGFRLVYGAGFLYDRNWGDEDDNND